MLWLSKNSKKVSFLGKHKSCASVDEWEMGRPNVLHALVPLSLSKSLEALLKTNRNNLIKIIHMPIKINLGSQSLLLRR